MVNCKGLLKQYKTICKGVSNRQMACAQRTDAYYDEDLKRRWNIFPSKRDRHEKQLAKSGWQKLKEEYECDVTAVCFVARYEGDALIVSDVIVPRVYVTYTN